jgi:predicted alpha/beta-fold hydrolase
MRGATKSFHPPGWLRNPHVQTIVGRTLRLRCDFPYARRRVETPDGDFVDVDGAGEEAGLASSAPVCLVLHGLEGSSASGYAARTCTLLVAAGVRPYVLNFRSCSGELNRRLRSYHSGATADIAYVAGRLAELHPGVPLGAIGYSLGGNALLCRLAEGGANSEFRAAAAVSVPFDLAAGADCLEVGMGRVYTRYFLGSLHAKIAAKAERFPEARPAAERALRARTIRGIDEAWTAPIHGFRDAGHYYEVCSSLPRLPEIRIPTLLLQSTDDPFLPRRTPDAVARVDNPALDKLITHFGGHLGYVARDPDHRLWAEARAVSWLARRLHENDRGDQR